METISINGKDYLSYASVTQADDYLGAAIYAEGWQDETDVDVKGRALVTATRWIDSIAWAGTPVDPAQLNAWPRSGIEGVDEYGIPLSIINATIELANMLYDNPELQAELSDVTAKRLKAGSVEIEYFRGVSVQTLTPFPKSIMNMVRPLLGSQGNAAGAGAIAYGTECPSKINQPYGVTWPL